MCNTQEKTGIEIELTTPAPTTQTPDGGKLPDGVQPADLKVVRASKKSVRRSKATLTEAEIHAIYGG